MSEHIREQKQKAEDAIAAAIKGFYVATGMTPEFCILLGQEKNQRGEIVGLGDLTVHLRVNI